MTTPRGVTKIVSGGQTGVDRAALDVAIRLEIPHGGWVPLGRLAEDFRHPVLELPFLEGGVDKRAAIETLADALETSLEAAGELP